MSTLIDLALWIVDVCTYWRFWIPVTAAAPAFLLNYWEPGRVWPWFVSVPLMAVALVLGSCWQFVWHRERR